MEINLEVRPHYFFVIQLSARVDETGKVLWRAIAEGAQSLSFWEHGKKHEAPTMEEALSIIGKDLRETLEKQETV